MLWDDFWKSNEPSLCHKFLSMLCLVVPVCSPTIGCRVYQYVPNTRISRQFETRRLTNLPPFPIFLSDGCQDMVWRTCIIARLLCLPIPFNTFYRMSFHVVESRSNACTIHRFEWDVIFDHWPTHRSIRDVRTVFQVKELAHL